MCMPTRCEQMFLKMSKKVAMKFKIVFPTSCSGADFELVLSCSSIAIVITGIEYIEDGKALIIDNAYSSNVGLG